MDEVDNKYIGNTIDSLLNSIGIKEPVDSWKILSLIRSNKVREATEEIATYLGLPVKINLSYVPEGYRPNNTDGFQSNHLVKTDWRGRGVSGITAQVSIPSNLPLYGTPSMVNFPVNMSVSENCSNNPMTLTSIIAHELSHIVLYSIMHKEKDNEFYTDLTAMILGFSRVMRVGREVVTTDSVTHEGLLSNSTTATTQTTTYGYLSDNNSNFAYDKIEEILKKYRNNKDLLLKKIKTAEKELEKQKKDTVFFRNYLNYLDKNLPKKISQQDGIWIANFHQGDYTDEFNLSVKRTENEFKQFASLVNGLKHYTNYRFEEIKKAETKFLESVADTNSKHDQIRGAVMILKKYIPIIQRFQIFLKIRSKTLV